ncbi:MAG: hypothetical protein AB7V56_12230 [Candidatus Nitrosocosmicus sp.]
MVSGTLLHAIIDTSAKVIEFINPMERKVNPMTAAKASVWNLVISHIAYCS